jgi:DNA replication protein DnaC
MNDSCKLWWRLPAEVSRQVRTLLEGSFVDRRENLLMFGKTGTGKTHLASAIGQELIRNSGRTVISWKCALLVQELLVAKRDLKLSRVLKRFSKYEVLLIDDIGYVQQNREEMEVLFTLLAERYAVLPSHAVGTTWEITLLHQKTKRGTFRNDMEHQKEA